MYDGSEGDYELQSLVGFYGQHYFAFVRQPDSSWLQFDDATVRPPCSYLPHVKSRDHQPCMCWVLRVLDMCLWVLRFR